MRQAKHVAHVTWAVVGLVGVAPVLAAGAGLTWSFVSFNLTGGPVEVVVDASVACESREVCLVAVAYVTDNDNGAGFSYATAGRRASVSLAGDHLLSLEQEGQVALSSGYHTTFTFDPSWAGSEGRLAVLSSEPAEMSLQVTPGNQLQHQESGSQTAHYAMASDFVAAADAVVTPAAAGVRFSEDLGVRNGVLAVYSPYGFLSAGRAASWSGPTGHGACIVTVVLGGCLPFGLMGGTGVWRLDALHRAAAPVQPDEVWLLYVDVAAAS